MVRATKPVGTKGGPGVFIFVSWGGGESRGFEPFLCLPFFLLSIFLYSAVSAPSG